MFILTRSNEGLTLINSRDMYVGKIWRTADLFFLFFLIFNQDWIEDAIKGVQTTN